jgi:hypothetical protein
MPTTRAEPVARVQRPDHLPQLFGTAVLDEGQQAGEGTPLAALEAGDQRDQVGGHQLDLDDQRRRPGRRRRTAPRRRSPPRRRSSLTRETTMRAPEHPIGWPSATPPPLTLTGPRDAELTADAIATDAKASLISYRSNPAGSASIFAGPPRPDRAAGCRCSDGSGRRRCPRT